MSEHISRRELKQDKFRDSLEHGAEAVASHRQLASMLLLVGVLLAAGFGGWKIYADRRTVKATAALDAAAKVYNARIRGAGEASETGEITYPDEAGKMRDASVKFAEVADTYPSTNAGRQARYYQALCLEDLEQFNQALEQLKKLEGAGDPELAAMARYQTAVINGRTGKPEEAVKILRALVDKPSVFVPRSLALLELAGQLRSNNPHEAAGIYQQLKKEFPDSPIAEEADRGLGMLPKS